MGSTKAGGAGGLFTANCFPPAADVGAEPPAEASSFAEGTAQVTSPEGPTESFSLAPFLPRNSASKASSSQLARSTFWLRARIATCESTSTACAAGRRTAEMPAGMSSQPVSVSVTAKIGPLPAGSSTGRAFMASTVPTVTPAPALTSSQGPRPAPRRSCGWRPRKHCATSRSERQRAVSSPKVPRIFGSGRKTAPGLSPPARRRSAHDCNNSATVSATPAQMTERRSQAASMSLHQSVPQRWAPP
mmetsp:Transcript_112085/g.280812  ORF Transcript_112085/g.280812 Transcript_112085/m.280812 type:complete len:246 (-) Transcript_112085:2478-3215(-)